MKKTIKTSFLLFLILSLFFFTACEKQHEHVFSVKVIEPTCQEQGYTLHKCECGYEYTDDYKPVRSHYGKEKCVWCGLDFYETLINAFKQNHKVAEGEYKIERQNGEDTLLISYNEELNQLNFFYKSHYSVYSGQMNDVTFEFYMNKVSSQYTWMFYEGTDINKSRSKLGGYFSTSYISKDYKQLIFQYSRGLTPELEETFCRLGANYTYQLITIFGEMITEAGNKLDYDNFNFTKMP